MDDEQALNEMKTLTAAAAADWAAERSALQSCGLLQLAVAAREQPD